MLKLIILTLVQAPLMYQYHNTGNMIYLFIWQFLLTIFIVGMDNAISVNHHSVREVYQCFQDLLEKISKPIKVNEDDEEDDEDISGEI